jgi:hypothetical protein
MKRDRKYVFQGSNRCSSCLNKIYERHLCTNTFTGNFSWVLTLGGWSIRVYSGVSGLPGVSGFTPNILGLRAVTALFCVRGYKSPLHPFLSLSLSFRPAKLQNTFTPSFTPFGSKLVRFGGDLRGIEGKSLKSASELISHL